MVAVSAGQASADQLVGGSTALKLNKGLAKVLEKKGVEVAPVGPAKVKGGKVVFPIKGGKINPATGASKIRHSGGLRFKAGKTKLVARSFTVKTGDSNRLSGKVGGSRVSLFKLDLSKAKINRSEINVKVHNVKLRLTATAAKALNSTFGVRRFKRGMKIGRVVVDTQAKSVALQTRGSTDLTLDPGTAQALTDLGVAAAPVGAASVTPEGAIAFPITGGRVDPSSFAGSIKHSGGISLTAGMTTVELTDFVINIDQQPDLTALVGGARVSILDLDLSGLGAKVDGRKITLSNVAASLTSDAAGALNAAFGVNAFTEGLVLGNATVNAVAR